MKNRFFEGVLVGMCFIALFHFGKPYLVAKQKPYTILITNGNSKIHYTAEMQVDSFKQYEKNSMIVFVDSLMLPIKGGIITFKKN